MGDITPPKAPGPIYTAPAPLQPSHDVSRFDCGRPVLNEWLRARALQSEGQSARSYVACAGNVVAGYYCIATGSIVHEATTAKLRRNMPDPIPAMILARLAVDKDHQGRGLGRALLKDAFQRVLAASRIIGARCLIVHPIDREAEGFYTGYGFIPLPAETKTLFLPLDTIAKGL